MKGMEFDSDGSESSDIVNGQRDDWAVLSEMDRERLDSPAQSKSPIPLEEPASTKSAIKNVIPNDLHQNFILDTVKNFSSTATSGFTNLVKTSASFRISLFAVINVLLTLLTLWIIGVPLSQSSQHRYINDKVTGRGNMNCNRGRQGLERRLEKHDIAIQELTNRSKILSDSYLEIRNDLQSALQLATECNDESNENLMNNGAMDINMISQEIEQIVGNQEVLNSFMTQVEKDLVGLKKVVNEGLKAKGIKDNDAIDNSAAISVTEVRMDALQATVEKMILNQEEVDSKLEILKNRIVDIENSPPIPSMPDIVRRLKEELFNLRKDSLSFFYW